MILSHGLNSISRGSTPPGPPPSWDGSRDYSFYVGKSSPYSIKTPAQYAALCYISNGKWQTDETCPSDISATDRFSGKEVSLDNDLIFNDGYENNFDWMELTSQSGHVNPPANDCTLLRLHFDGSFHGNFHSLKGIFYHQSTESPAAYGSGEVFNQTNGGAFENLYFENCSLKNWKQGQFYLFHCDSASLFYNIQVRHCRMVGLTKTSGGMGSVQFGYLVGSWSVSPQLYGCGIVDSDAYFDDPTGYAWYRRNGLHLAKWEPGGYISNDFNVNVNIGFYNAGYIFSNENKDNCLYYNQTGSGNYDGSQTSSVSDLISRHNSFSDGHSLKLDENLRYIPGQLSGS